jgi:hypothetical protein
LKAILIVDQECRNPGIHSSLVRSGCWSLHVLFPNHNHMKSLKLILIACLLLATGNVFSQICVTPDNASIIAWWSFDDTTSSVVRDVTGQHNGVLVNGTKWASGHVSNAASFDGTNDYVGVPDDSVWAFGANNFSIEFWAKFATAPGGTVSHPSNIFIGSDNGAGSLPKWFFALGGGVLNFHVNGSTTSGFFAQASFSPTINQWYHLAVTRSGDTLRIFVDGQLKQSQVVSGLFVPDASVALTIGQAESLGYTNGSLDEMTVYNRALSTQELTAIYNAGTAGKCKSIRITTTPMFDLKYGTPFSQTLSSIMGKPPLTWTVIGGSLPPGITLSTSGVLSGTPTQAGDFSFTVQVQDSNNATDQKLFTLRVLLTLPASKVTLYKSSTVPVPGREVDYFILVTNVGTVAINSGIVHEYIDPWYAYKSSGPAAAVVGGIPNYYTVDDSTDTQPSIIEWTINLQPGETSILTYKVKLQPGFPIGGTVNGRICYWETCITPNELASCEQQYSSCQNAALANAQASCYSDCVANGGGYGCNNVPCCVVNCYAATIYNAASDLADCLQDFENCAKNANTSCLNCYNDEDTGQGAIDPNEKLVLAPHYIKPNTLLPFVIHFENIGTIEAQDVFITDTLDADLDETTLNVITPGGSFNSSTRVLKWSLLGINLQPDSSSSVLYTIKPKANLPSGAVIKNKASIQFEVFAPMSTNETENIIDLTAPNGVMDSLPPITYQTTFPVSWKGTDTVGEIKSYSVFVSTNGGGYVPLLTATKDTTAFFTGATGNTYRFISIAEDVAGNTEVQQPIAEATTQLVVLCSNRYYYDADNDGYGNRSIRTIACSKPTHFVTDSTDCDDANAAIHPGTWEVRDGKDNDCDGFIDEDILAVEAGPCRNVYPGYSPAACTVLHAAVAGGSAPYTYVWSNNATTSSITVCPTQSTMYKVKVTDKNNVIARDSVQVNIIDVRCGNNNSKVEVCHSGNNSLCIASSAVSAHLNHGDRLGACSVTNPCGSTVRISGGNEEILFLLIPNPADDQVELQTNLYPSAISVTDVSGKVVLHQALTDRQNMISTSALSNGIYFVRLSDASNCYVKRFEVRH